MPQYWPESLLLRVNASQLLSERFGRFLSEGAESTDVPEEPFQLTQVIAAALAFLRCIECAHPGEATGCETGTKEAGEDGQCSI